MCRLGDSPTLAPTLRPPNPGRSAFTLTKRTLFAWSFARVGPFMKLSFGCQGASEYQRKFAWVPSKKSASFQPSDEQSAAPAGIVSTHTGTVSLPWCKSFPNGEMNNNNNNLEGV